MCGDKTSIWISPELEVTGVAADFFQWEGDEIHPIGPKNGLNNVRHLEQERTEGDLVTRLHPTPP